MSKKIAFPTDDGKTISAHLGQAQYFQIITLDGNQVVKSESVDKLLHHHPEAHHAEHEGHGAHNHQEMFAPLEGCQVLIAGGMGGPAFQHLQEMGLEIYLTRHKEISAALAAYLAGQMDNDPRRIHMH